MGGPSPGSGCSGFVARCWNLPFKQSTRSLGRLCFELASYDELLPGDFINKFDAHAAFPAVKESVYWCAALKRSGFTPFRYKPLDERWTAVTRAPVATELQPEGGAWVAEGEAESFDVDELLEGVDLDAMAVLSGTITQGHWLEGGLSLPGYLVALRLQGSMTSRSNDLPLEVAHTVVVSPLVPLEGIVSWDRVTTYQLPSGPLESTMRYRLSAYGSARIR